MNRTFNEVDISALTCSGRAPVHLLDQLADAIDRAADQDGVTWLTERGKRIAALVPVETAEYVEDQVKSIP